jgi:hypothetical protein
MEGVLGSINAIQEFVRTRFPTIRADPTFFFVEFPGHL